MFFCGGVSLKKHLLVHIPHSSLLIPSKCKKRLIKNIRKENIFISDYLVDRLVSKKVRTIKFRYSRMFCDVERFNTDEEVMNKYGMGVVYSKDSNESDFIVLDEEYKNNIISNYYNKHHDTLNKEVSNIINMCNRCVLVDLHSFSELFIKKVFDKDDAPDICIGVENKYTSKLLVEQTINHFKKYNYSVKINYPYEGSIIPNKYFDVYDERLDTIMIELNKKIYLNNNNKLDKKKFNKLKRCINKYFKTIK